jgi:hypothetical protein
VEPAEFARLLIWLNIEHSSPCLLDPVVAEQLEVDGGAPPPKHKARFSRAPSFTIVLTVFLGGLVALQQKG